MAKVEVRDKDGQMQIVDIRYPELPWYSAQKHEYETRQPKDWKHAQLPGWINDLRIKLDQLLKEQEALEIEIPEALKALALLKRRGAPRDQLKASNDQALALRARQSSLKGEEERVQIYLSAHMRRYREGVMIGLPTFPELETSYEVRDGKVQQYQG